MTLWAVYSLADGALIDVVHGDPSTSDGYQWEAGAMGCVDLGTDMVDFVAKSWDAATRSLVDNIDALRAMKVAAVCAKAEAVRDIYLTPGSGQAMTYTRKESEARAWAEGADPDAFPFLKAEAAACGMTMADLVALVISQADAWVSVGSAIEAVRRGKLVQIDAATTAAEIAAIDVTAGWPA